MFRIGLFLMSFWLAVGSTSAADQKSKVTFVELGSLNCIPCRMMQPVMQALEKKYPNDLNLVFIDVWTDAGREAAKAYRFRAIPTQIFMDEQGEQFYKHEGFLPQEAIEKVLATKGVER